MKFPIIAIDNLIIYFVQFIATVSATVDDYISKKSNTIIVACMHSILCSNGEL